jgi:hypothetical protein
MLPHFPKAHLAMKDTFNRTMFDSFWKAAPILRRIRCYHFVEGSRNDYEQEDGTIVESDQQLARVEYSIRYENATGLRPEVFLEHAEELGRKMGERMEGQLFQTVSAMTDQIGNSVAIGQNGDMTFEQWLEMNTKVMTDFDDDGEPHTKHIVCTPEFQKKIMVSLDEWERDPEKVAAMKAVMAKQKEAYDAREARRRMVD